MFEKNMTTAQPSIADLIQRFRFGKPAPREVRTHAVRQERTGGYGAGESTAGAGALLEGWRGSTGASQRPLAAARHDAPLRGPEPTAATAAAVTPALPPLVFNFDGFRTRGQGGASGGGGGGDGLSTHRYHHTQQPYPHVPPARVPPWTAVPSMGRMPSASAASTVPYPSVLGPEWGQAWGRADGSGLGSAAVTDSGDWAPPGRGFEDGYSGSEEEEEGDGPDLQDWEYPGLKETTGELAEQLDFTMMRLAKR